MCNFFGGHFLNAGRQAPPSEQGRGTPRLAARYKPGRAAWDGPAAWGHPTAYPAYPSLSPLPATATWGAAYPPPPPGQPFMTDQLYTTYQYIVPAQGRLRSSVCGCCFCV